MIQRYTIVFILGLIIGFWKYSGFNLLAGFSKETFRITIAYLMMVFVFGTIAFLLGGLLRFLKNAKNKVQNELNNQEEADKEIDFFKGKAFSKYVLYTAIVMFFLFASDSCEVF
jgi:TRAP-type C4-dicarboxylate transport system permease small subunit